MGTSVLPLWVLAKVFASGCTAMTGVEAVSERGDGVPSAGAEEREEDADGDHPAADGAAGGDCAAVQDVTASARRIRVARGIRACSRS